MDSEKLEDSPREYASLERSTNKTVIDKTDCSLLLNSRLLYGLLKRDVFTTPILQLAYPNHVIR